MHPRKSEVLTFFETFMEAHHAVELFVEKIFFAGRDITMIQFGILKQLIKRGGQVNAMTELWCDHHTTRGNLTGIISRMVESGLVSRTEEASDRRQKLISITPAGKEKFAEIEQVMDTYIPDFLSKMEGISLSSVTEALSKIRDCHSIPH